MGSENIEFLANMQEAARGEPEALRNFYETFLKFIFFVPERYQKSKLSLTPVYPNDFTNLLGVNDGPRTFVPIFTSHETLENWFGNNELSYQRISGLDLLNKIPSDWWMMLDPAEEIQKEISPWEIEELKAGSEGISHIIEDALPSFVQERAIHPVKTEDHPKLIERLLKEKERFKFIGTIWIAREEEIVEAPNKNRSTIIVGVEVLTSKDEELNNIQKVFSAAANQAMIGDLPVAVYTGISPESLTLGMFKAITPLAKSKKNQFKNLFCITNLLACIIFFGYLYFFIQDLSPYWFSTKWTTDDAMQQVYPFHEVAYPGLFKDDLPTDVMKGYLAPLHYGLSWILTYLLGDVILMSHTVMLIQILTTVVFIFLAVKNRSSFAAGLIAASWFLHTRPVVQRMTGGLPRGWAAPLLSAFIYFLLSGNHIAILITIFLGCLLHPPATLIASLSYGLFLSWKFLFTKDRHIFRKHLLLFLCACPIYAILTFFVISRPDSIGQMVDFQTASSMPEFQWPTGRFPFLPLPSIPYELERYAFQPFFSRLYEPLPWIKEALPYFISTIFAVLIITGIKAKRSLIPIELAFFLIATVITYLSARAFAFKLYVPNRHLQFPLSIFIITALSIGLWNIFTKLGKQKPLYGYLGILPVLFVVYLGSNNGLIGTANFNYHANRKGTVFQWVKNNLPLDALIAGHPTHINGLPLFGARRAYATTEIAHPFYPKYYAEIKRRLTLSLNAHYAKSLNQLVEILEPEGVQYFIFAKNKFNSSALKNETFFTPLDALIKELTLGEPASFAYNKLPKEVNVTKYSFLLFRDKESALIDVVKLKSYLATNHINED
ncbi:MAG: SseB family protein [bacterium]|nr:SseB family protein [bacterium]